MDFKVIFKETFLADLQRILQRIAPENAPAAQKLGEIVVSTAESLSFFPERYPKVRQRPGIRRFVVQKYFKVFYQIDQKARVVDILRCWDGRRSSDPRFTS